MMRLAMMLCIGLLYGVAALAAPLPYTDGNKHLGMATCSGSACHGSTRAFIDAAVMQNEYYIWTREDRHARAFKTLLGDESKRIGRLLGIQPESDARCLVCHSDFVPEDQRGKRFRLSDGVGCEACHGGAENYLGPHVSGDVSHAENVAAGLYPSERPSDRARLCLSCHLGSDDHPIDHEIMGAGHPPLRFELDTYTAIQPAHFTVDADYRQRKGEWTAVQTWASGQAVMAVELLKGLSSARFKSHGMFPELVFFDCNACHHVMEADRWQAGTAAGARPGTVRLPDASYRMLGHVLAQIDASMAKNWMDGVATLHRASRDGVSAVKQAARALQPLAESAVKALDDHAFSADQIKGLMRDISDDARGPGRGDFTHATQSIMALEALFVSLQKAGQVSESQAGVFRDRLNALYALTESEFRFDSGVYAEHLKALRAAM